MNDADIYSESPRVKINLRRVGLTGILIPVHISEREGVPDLLCKFDLFTDLPDSRRGGDFSKQLQAVSFLSSHSDVLPRPEELTLLVATELSKKLNYAERFDVRLRADMFSPDKDRSSISHDVLVERTILTHSGKMKTFVGVEVQGMTACPCTMEKMRKRLTEENLSVKAALADLPIVTHNQRNRTRVMIELTVHGESVIDSLLAAAREVIGFIPEIGVLESDVDLVYRVHKNPLFVEDVVREVGAKLKELLPTYPKNSLVRISSTSEESIRHHDAFAEFKGKFSDL